jgi:hypothetical protein
MKYVCCQPAIDYYTWQVEVMINNFINNGVNPNNIEIVCGYSGNEVPANWRKLSEHYNTVRFFFYKDERVKPSYISSIRPHILHQHWLRYPELADETIFYHDCDIVLSKKADFNDLLQDDINYVSDTVSYIGARYILSKGDHYLDLMSTLVNVNKEKIIQNEENSGGAQYLIKSVPAEFWKKVYYDSENLFRVITEQIKKDNPPHALQIWCADMWAVLWNLWFFDREVRVTEKMSFSWATSGIHEWDAHPIFHNAGVTSDRKDLFFKGAYMSQLPYSTIENQVFNTNYCSFNYIQEIIKTKQKSCLV